MRSLVQAHFNLLGLEEDRLNNWIVPCVRDKNSKSYKTYIYVGITRIRYKQIIYYKEDIPTLFKRVAEDMKHV